MEALLQVENLSVNFYTSSGCVRAVRGVDFELYPGETVALVGESGSGKSVTAQSILQLLPTPPARVESGRIRLAGEDLLTKSPREMQSIRGKRIGMVFQNPMTSLNPTMRIGQQITESLCKHQKMSQKEAIQEAIHLLEDVGLPQAEDRLSQYPHQFSGGMRQRVMMAIALACHPELLIADEPTTALDVTIQAQMLELMKTLQQKRGMSVLLITHDLGVVAGICDRVIVLYAGKVVETGTVQQLFSSPQHPYTQALLHSVPRLGLDRKRPLASIPGSPPDLLHPITGCAFCPRCEHAMQVCPRYTPHLTKISSSHSSACWLHHRFAPQKQEASS